MQIFDILRNYEFVFYYITIVRLSRDFSIADDFNIESAILPVI